MKEYSVLGRWSTLKYDDSLRLDVALQEALYHYKNDSSYNLGLSVICSEYKVPPSWVIKILKNGYHFTTCRVRVTEPGKEPYLLITWGIFFTNVIHANNRDAFCLEEMVDILETHNPYLLHHLESEYGL